MARNHLPLVSRAKVVFSSVLWSKKREKKGHTTFASKIDPFRRRLPLAPAAPHCRWGGLACPSRLRRRTAFGAKSFSFFFGNFKNNFARRLISN